LHWELGSTTYTAALQQEADYWGEEIEKAVAVGIPFSADMRRAQRLFVHRGAELPQQQIYDPVAEQIMNGHLYQNLFDRIADVSQQAHVLVLTCGPGGLALELARQGHHVQAIDISRRAIAIAERMAAENPFHEHFGSLSYEVADLNRITLPEGGYDVVLAWDGLHHIIALDHLMSEIHKTLRAGGIFIFSDHVGIKPVSRVLGGLLYLFLPTYVPFNVKFKYALGGASKIKEEMTNRSPFEEATCGQIMDAVRKQFVIKQEIEHTGVGYRAAIAGDLRWRDALKHPFLRRLKQLDDWAVRHKLLHGDHVLVVAQIS
jgi:SAM-dependent methyltransferase